MEDINTQNDANLVRIEADNDTKIISAGLFGISIIILALGLLISLGGLFNSKEEFLSRIFAAIVLLFLTALLATPFYLGAKNFRKRVERGYTVDIINKKYIHSDGKVWELCYTDICSIKKIETIEKKDGEIKTTIKYTFTIPVDDNGKMETFSYSDGDKRNRIVYAIEKATGCNVEDLGCERIINAR